MREPIFETTHTVLSCRDLEDIQALAEGRGLLPLSTELETDGGLIAVCIDRLRREGEGVISFEAAWEGIDGRKDNDYEFVVGRLEFDQGGNINAAGSYATCQLFQMA